MTHHQQEERRLTARTMCSAHSCRSRASWFVRVLLVGVLGVIVDVLIGRYSVNVVSAIHVAIFVVISVTGDVLFTPPVGDNEMHWLLPN